MKARFRDIIAKDPVDTYSGDSIAALKKFAKKHAKNLVIGYLSYDLAYKLHNVPQTAKDNLKLPHIHLLAFNKWSKRPIPKDEANKLDFKTIIKRKDYKKGYNKIKNYIKEGDIYQINLTHRLEAESELPAKEIFHQIAASNNVSHLAYIEGEGFEILSASPERFIKIEGNHIETKPVKGTIPIAQDPKTLIESEKEAAELNMITDLLRNDMGKVCKPGSVKVKGHRLLQKCPTVWHTYSHITGELATDRITALLSMFPGGSITGCPKKRAIEIIDELEPNTRGPYTGCVICLHPDYLDSSIAIRTVIKKGNKLYLQVGGGIVLDSKEESEYQETLDKAASFMKNTNNDRPHKQPIPKKASIQRKSVSRLRSL